jgi:hypothetical protein
MTTKLSARISVVSGSILLTRVTGLAPPPVCRIEYPATGIPGFNRKGTKTAKTCEEIYKIFLRVFVVYSKTFSKAS